GINVTINTDNRTVSNTTLTNEILVSKDNFNMDFEIYKNIYLTSVEAAFTTSEVKNKLKADLEKFVI
ncbi:MAG: adenosine deaminase, partial [Clostridium sp.]